MEMLRTICLLVSLVIAVSLYASTTYCQPSLSQRTIPSGIDPKVKEKIKQLYSADAIQRAYATIGLGNLREEARDAVPFLKEMLHDDVSLGWGSPCSDDTSPGKEAAMALVSIDKDLSSFLIDKLLNTRTDPVVRGTIALALGEIGDSQAIDSLRKSLVDKHYAVRRSAAKGLASKKNPNVIQSLIIALKDKSSDVRAEVAASLAQSENTIAVPYLIEILKDKNPRVRMEVVYALGVIHDPRTIEPLVAALQDQSDDVRKRVLEVSIWKADVAFVDPLLGILKRAKSKNETWAVEGCPKGMRFGYIVSKHVAEALTAITKKDFGEDYSKWKEWWDQHRQAVPRGR